VSEKYDEALPLLIRAFRLDPLYIFYYSALGVCQHNQEKFDIALECYDVALDLADKARSSENHDYMEAVEGLSRKCEKNLKATTSEVNHQCLN
jgi:tetratricopeptide (TPR) repeat protein